MSKKKNDGLDTETSFADMNVEGFKWYNPSAKKRDPSYKKVKNKVSRKEYWAMVKGAFAAVLPFVLGLLLIGGILYLIAWLWLM